MEQYHLQRVTFARYSSGTCISADSCMDVLQLNSRILSTLRRLYLFPLSLINVVVRILFM